MGSFLHRDRTKLWGFITKRIIRFQKYALKTAEKSLTEYEKRLGLVKRFSESREAVAEIEAEISKIESEHVSDKALQKRLDRIKNIIETLEF